MSGSWATSSVPAGTQWSFPAADDDAPFHTSPVVRRPFSQLLGFRGQCPSSTTPTHPVTVRAHSADASSHLNPAPRMNRLGKRDELPPVSDFTIDAILASLKPEIEARLEAIAEILGRSKLSLANEYGSHMPPQGEIRANSGSTLLPVEEADSGSEHMVLDDVLIVPEDASLIEGSHCGSAAYGLLERLMASPSARRIDFHPQDPPPSSTLLENVEETQLSATLGSLLGHGARTTEPLVAETHLSARANIRLTSAHIDIMDSDHQLYYDSSIPVVTPSEVRPQTQTNLPRTVSRHLPLISDVRSLASWLHRNRRHPETSEDAETRLRVILGRKR